MGGKDLFWEKALQNVEIWIGKGDKPMKRPSEVTTGQK